MTISDQKLVEMVMDYDNCHDDLIDELARRFKEKSMSYKLKVKKLHPNAKLPKKTYKFDACFDLYSNEHCNLKPGNIVCVDTGIAMEIPEGYAGFIWDRSGLGSKGIHRLAGVVDSTYRDSVKVVLINLGKEEKYNKDYFIYPGDRIAQIFITKVEDFEIEEGELSETDRGEKGFGSSGR